MNYLFIRKKSSLFLRSKLLETSSTILSSIIPNN
jgi:hypothetical protein